MIPQPPDHITGKIGRTGHYAIRRERDAWIAAQRIAGFTEAEVAAALGIHKSTIARNASNGGYVKKIHNQKPVNRYNIESSGLRMGRPTAAIAALPVPMQHACLDYAAKHRTTVMVAMAAMLVAATARPAP